MILIKTYKLFDSIWFAWVFKWKEYDISIVNIQLKTWKNCLWFINWKIYLFEENQWQLEYIL